MNWETKHPSWQNINIDNGIVWEDRILIFVSFIGITGYLPYVALLGKILGK